MILMVIVIINISTTMTITVMITILIIITIIIIRIIAIIVVIIVVIIIISIILILILIIIPILIVLILKTTVDLSLSAHHGCLKPSAALLLGAPTAESAFVRQAAAELLRSCTPRPLQTLKASKPLLYDIIAILGIWDLNGDHSRSSYREVSREAFGDCRRGVAGAV